MSNEFKIGDFVRHSAIVDGVQGIPGTVVDVIGDHCLVELRDGVKRMTLASELYRGTEELFTVGEVVLDCSTGKRLTVVYFENYYGAVLSDDFNTHTREYYAASRLAHVVGESDTPQDAVIEDETADSKVRRCVSVMVGGRVKFVSYFYPDDSDWEREMMGTLKLYTMIPNSHVSVYTDDVPF